MMPHVFNEGLWPAWPGRWHVFMVASVVAMEDGE